MKIGLGQFLCVVSGVLLLSIGGGLTGARWAIERHERSASTRQAEESGGEPQAASGQARSMAPQVGEVVPSAAEETSGPAPESKPESAPEASSVPSAVKRAPKMAPSVTASPRASERDQSERYVIQAISTPRRQDAAAARNRVMERGFSAGIFEVDLGERGKWYRVYIGPYEAEDSAREVLKSVRLIPGFEASFVKALD